jgi:hypothetical protein
MIVARKLAVTAVLAAVLALAPFMSMTAKAAPSLGQAQLTSYTTAQQPTAAAKLTVTKNCTFGSSSGNVKTCLTTYHKGRYVLQMKVSGCVVHSGRELFEGIGGPNGAIVENPTAFGYWVSPGSCNTLPWDPFATVPPGKYCGYTYRVVEIKGGVKGYLIGKVCINL